ncbi:hypothetical protein [Nitrobacter vulgaris]|uniref:Uncharacterized protein n=1 Tax=Nitrobacter vulgaris TaxID=29421 RepID=A0A1V4HZH3_NITVU|nr:hypothetical protein [Nitrobacter vulgaris]OPH82980.1 hypothetical protein B2M20_10740 [Nitrobacter vulgaris]
MTNTTDRPATSADDLYYPMDVTPEQFFQAWSRSEREALIELLIGTLDTTDDCDEDRAVDDGPCDEDPDAEPPLGWTDRESRWGKPVFTEGEDEPILAAVPAIDQAEWASGNQDDREGDGCADDREDVCEDEGAEHDGREPSFGWSDVETARGRHPNQMGGDQ